MKIRIFAALLPALFLSVSARAQPVVVVLDHGEAPRAELRYEFKAGQTEKATMAMSAQMSMAMGGVAQPATSIPTIRMPVSTHVTEIYPDGSARYEFGMEPASLVADGSEPAANMQMLGALLAQMGSASGWGRIDARGQALDGGFNLPDGVPAPVFQIMGGMQGQMQQLSAPFPAEAVGVGARWQTTTTLQMAGVSSSLVAEYTLLAREGDTVELGMTMTQSPPDLPLGGGQTSATAQGAAGSGRMVVDLTRTMPQMEMTQRSSTSMTMGGQTQPMTMSTQMTMSIMPE